MSDGHGGTGHVFHPGHEELHGVTVVVRGQSGKTYLGRYHEQTERGVLLHDVGVHHPGGDVSVEAWLERSNKFGVRADHKALMVPNAEVGDITRFG